MHGRLLRSVLRASAASLLGCGAASGLLVPGGSLGSDDSGALGSRTSDGSAVPDASTKVGDDASRDAWSPVCPANAPTVGAACPEDALFCEYVATQGASCDEIVLCSGGVWASSLPPGSPTGCPSGPNSAACPATFQGVPSGGACAETATCQYPDGFCVCASVLLPEVTAPEMLWRCGPEPGCAAAPPRLGASCSALGMTCTYPSCVGVTCTEQGDWQPSGLACGG
jgi:hypothetical protein